jgi:hypothetical protein
LRKATGWTAGVRFPAGAIEFYVLHNVQTGSDVLPASYPMGTGALSSEAERPGREANPSPSNVEVKNGGAVPPLVHSPSLRGACFLIIILKIMKFLCLIMQAVCYETYCGVEV